MPDRGNGAPLVSRKSSRAVGLQGDAHAARDCPTSGNATPWPGCCRRSPPPRTSPSQSWSSQIDNSPWAATPREPSRSTAPRSPRRGGVMARLPFCHLPVHDCVADRIRRALTTLTASYGATETAADQTPTPVAAEIQSGGIRRRYNAWDERLADTRAVSNWAHFKAQYSRRAPGLKTAYTLAGDAAEKAARPTPVPTSRPSPRSACAPAAWSPVGSSTPGSARASTRSRSAPCCSAPSSTPPPPSRPDGPRARPGRTQLARATRRPPHRIAAGCLSPPVRTRTWRAASGRAGRGEPTRSSDRKEARPPGGYPRTA